MTNQFDDLPVVVIGAGPVGLAAAAHLAERGIAFTVVEAGDRPAAAVREWGHVRLFSPWRYDIDASGTWTTPNVLGAAGIPAHGEELVAGFVESALPDVLGADRNRFAGKRTLVVGAGHSAANTLLLLAELATQVPGTSVVWAIRSTSAARTYGGESADALPARGAIGTRLREHVEAGTVELVTGFAVHSLTTVDGRVVASDGRREITADRIVSATGFRPDHSIAAELRLDLDPVLGAGRVLAPLIDPNEHSCGTVPPHGVDELTHPEPGYYAIGMKSYGRAPTFLLATGYEQARSVVAALAGDWAAARDVRLDLPETGVCSSDVPLESATITGGGRVGHLRRRLHLSTCRGTPWVHEQIVDVAAAPPDRIRPVEVVRPALQQSRDRINSMTGNVRTDGGSPLIAS